MSAGSVLPARITFLGTGTSTGVPMIGCHCAVCRSPDPRDRRLRPSIYVDVPGRAGILVDTTPDLRQQALTYDVPRVDAVLFTHAHADHIMGLDDLRRYNFMQQAPIPCYATPPVWEEIRKTFHYVFGEAPKQGGGVPKLAPREIDGPFEVAGVRVVPVPLWHGSLPIVGFRFGSFAYLTDCSAIPDESWRLVEGVETLVLDALRERKHSTHFTVEEAVAVAGRVGPRQVYLTHMAHDLGYVDTNARLPRGIALAYDGLVVDAGVEAS
jgi:phosphoribosyl 1,2-cyclic phosphate phosphodiesterase